MSFGLKTKNDIKEWKINYSKAMLEFPGGINDWFAFSLLLATIFMPIIVLLICFDIENGFFKSRWMLYSLFVTIGVICYYWIYFRNIEWLKGRIDKVSKKYYIK
jgi:hypothetical protein